MLHIPGQGLQLIYHGAECHYLLNSGAKWGKLVTFNRLGSAGEAAGKLCAAQNSRVEKTKEGKVSF